MSVWIVDGGACVLCIAVYFLGFEMCHLLLAPVCHFSCLSRSGAQPVPRMVHLALRHLLITPQEKAPTDSRTFGTLPPKVPGPDASVDDNPFGTRKARSSFGRGFFKIKSNKRTASAPNLGMWHRHQGPELWEEGKA